MSHQPFETWLFAQDELTRDQTDDLRAHRAECPACDSLARALGEAEVELRAVQPHRPAAGFAVRWLERQQRAADRRQARQAWWALGLAAGLALLLTAVLALGVIASPAELPARGLQIVAGWLADTSLAWGLISAFVGTLPVPVTLASGFSLALGLMAGLVGLAAAWFVFMQRFVMPLHRQGVSR